jgi:hypothetical protein
MSHGTEHHLEEAEHAQHHAADPYTQRVAMSMAIIAACLAFVALLSHRKHNEVIQKQIASTSEIIKASGEFTKASNTWSQYQAKRVRSYMFESDAELLAAMPTGAADGSGPTAAEKQIKKWRDKMKEYDTGDPNWEKKKEDREKRESEKKEAAAGGDKAAQDPDSLPNLMKTAKELTAESDKRMEEAKSLGEESHHAHHQADFLDAGHLGLELGLVLCSIAVLTKSRMFWFSGIAVSAIGLVVAMLAFLKH